MVALLTVRAESLTLPLGIVALSITKKAKKVSMVVVVMAEKLLSPLELKGVKLSSCR